MKSINEILHPRFLFPLPSVANALVSPRGYLWYRSLVLKVFCRDYIPPSNRFPYFTELCPLFHPGEIRGPRCGFFPPHSPSLFPIPPRAPDDDRHRYFLPLRVPGFRLPKTSPQVSEEAFSNSPRTYVSPRLRRILHVPLQWIFHFRKDSTFLMYRPLFPSHTHTHAYLTANTEWSLPFSPLCCPFLSLLCTLGPHDTLSWHALPPRPWVDNLPFPWGTVISPFLQSGHPIQLLFLGPVELLTCVGIFLLLISRFFGFQVSENHQGSCARQAPPFYAFLLFSPQCTFRVGWVHPPLPHLCHVSFGFSPFITVFGHASAFLYNHARLKSRPHIPCAPFLRGLRPLFISTIDPQGRPFLFAFSPLTPFLRSRCAGKLPF